MACRVVLQEACVRSWIHGVPTISSRTSFPFHGDKVQDSAEPIVRLLFQAGPGHFRVRVHAAMHLDELMFSVRVCQLFSVSSHSALCPYHFILSSREIISE